MNNSFKLVIYASGLLLVAATTVLTAVTAIRSYSTPGVVAASVTTMQPVMHTAPGARPVVQLPTPTPEPPLPTPESMAPAFADICNLPASMTTDQRTAYLQTLVGKQVIGWRGRVAAVERWDLQQYAVKVDMRGGYLFSGRQVEILQVNRALARRLQVGQLILFDGLIRSIPLAAEGSCTPVYIEAARIIAQE